MQATAQVQKKRKKRKPNTIKTKALTDKGIYIMEDGQEFDFVEAVYKVKKKQHITIKGIGLAMNRHSKSHIKVQDVRNILHETKNVQALHVAAIKAAYPQILTDKTYEDINEAYEKLKKKFDRVVKQMEKAHAVEIGELQQLLKLKEEETTGLYGEFVKQGMLLRKKEEQISSLVAQLEGKTKGSKLATA